MAGLYLAFRPLHTASIYLRSIYRNMICLLACLFEYRQKAERRKVEMIRSLQSGRDSRISDYSDYYPGRREEARCCLEKILLVPKLSGRELSGRLKATEGAGCS